MADPVALRNTDDPEFYRQSAERTLEDLLAECKRGELVEVAYVIRKVDGRYTTGRSTTRSAASMAGCALHLAMDLLNAG